MATSENWQLFVHNGRHNHKIAIYSYGHAQPSSSGRVMFHLAIYYDFSENKTLVVQLEEPDVGKKYGRGSSPLKCRKGLHRFL
ncbi:hypothetical protein M9H77_19691 [Catharanthus roseus]|uniref:Uncharacterized protein n=1 Tax=Catharanthus roseus TaxID=4058 RepID=A0ACC0BB52_CATRO|nr:hypothetical protein M9H77_19691 [Catharanthus roseus]